MINIYQSNSINILKNELIDKITRHPLTQPFATEQILVQSPSIAQWLQQQIALSSGIAAAIDFPMPASFIWRLFQALIPNIPELSAFSKDAMTWKIMLLLPQCLKEEIYTPLKHYVLTNNHDTLTHSSNQLDQVKAYQLASKIADTFDQYLVYRPDWIAAWEKSDDMPSITHLQSWQPPLWRKITQYTLEQGQSQWHRGNLYTALISALNNSDFSASNHALPERLFVFGISTLPPAYLRVLEAISIHIDVSLMIHNPCQLYWGDIKTPKSVKPLEQSELHFSDNFLSDHHTTIEEGNTLLASMGKLGRDLHTLISDISAIENEHFIDPIDGAHDGHPPSMLAHIQSNILNLEEPEQPLTINKNDNSVTITSSHSPLREAEILHDYLLDLFQKNSSLTPKDIIIMAPDVETYSPAIQAVFSSTQHERFIPFAISDRNARRESPILEAFLKLINSPQTRFTINELITILEVPAVLRRYTIQAHQLHRLKEWVIASGIRWGLDTKHQKNQKLPEHFQNTWQFGIERMLLGYAIESEGALYKDQLPLPNIEGLEAALCGSLIEFINHLKWLAKTLEKDRTPSEWSLFVNQLLDQFFLPDNSEEPALQMIRDTLALLCEQTESAGLSKSLSHKVLIEWLTERLDTHKGSQRFLSGKVNVCTLMPMRSIPFKVVCLLGMNDGAYPRTIALGSFDLISKFPRQGDRSRRDDDRYLFLEALLAAKDNLYISYNGRNIKDDSERTPSVLLSELLDYCQRHFISAEPSQQSWVTQHPLHPFSPIYFQKDSKLFTYSKEWLSSASTQLQQEQPIFINQPLSPKEKSASIDLETLLKFYRNPCQYFFQQRLNTTYDTLADPIEDTEPFTVKGLSAFKIQTTLLENNLKGISQEKTIAVIKASGELPHEPFGEMTIKTLQTPVEQLSELIRPYINVPEEEKEVGLDVYGTQINGWLKGIYNHSLVRYRTSKSKNKFLVGCLIEHLVWCAISDMANDSYVFYFPKQKKNDYYTTLRPLSPQQSIDELNKLLNVYFQGNNEPLPFFPEASATWVQLAMDGFHPITEQDKVDNATLKAKKVFEKIQQQDEYISRVWPILNTTEFKRFTDLAEHLLITLSTHANSA